MIARRTTEPAETHQGPANAVMYREGGCDVSVTIGLSRLEPWNQDFFSLVSCLGVLCVLAFKIPARLSLSKSYKSQARNPKRGRRDNMFGCAAVAASSSTP